MLQGVSLIWRYIGGGGYVFPPFEKTVITDWKYTTNDSFTLETNSYVGVWVNGHYSGDYAAIYYTSPNGVGPVMVADRQAQHGDYEDEHYGIWYAFVKAGSKISMTGKTSHNSVCWRYFVTPIS